MSHSYATDWHQCFRCGLTRPDSALTKGRRHDTVLNIDEDVRSCTDPVLCARFQQFRDEAKQREAEDLQVELASAVIVERPKRKKSA